MRNHTTPNWRWIAAIIVIVAVAATGSAQVGILLARQPPPQTEFVPVSQLPPGDQLPAAPLLVAAYAFSWVAILLYFVSMQRRLRKVEQELAAVARQAGAGRRT
jgi:CcmD family protein